MSTQYSQMHTSTLFSIWKGNHEGSTREAERILIQRIETTGENNLRGPIKVLYVQNSKLKYTLLAPGENFGHKGITFGGDHTK